MGLFEDLPERCVMRLEDCIMTVINVLLVVGSSVQVLLVHAFILVTQSLVGGSAEETSAVGASFTLNNHVHFILSCPLLCRPAEFACRADHGREAGRLLSSIHLMGCLLSARGHWRCENVSSSGHNFAVLQKVSCIDYHGNLGFSDLGIN